MKKIAVLGLAAIMVAGSAFALNNATGNTTIRIITPLDLANTSAIDFGTVAQINGAACDETITPNGTGGTRAGTCDEILSAPGGDGDWVTTGEPGFAYDVTLSAVTTMAGPGAAIVVDTFTLFDGSVVTPFPGSTSGTIATAGLTIGGGGTDPFWTGATAHLAASQVTGTYTGSYNLLVSYV